MIPVVITNICICPHHNILTRGQAAQRRIVQRRGSAQAQPLARGVQWPPRWDKYLCIPMGENLHWFAAAALGTTVKCVSEKNALHLLYISCIKGMSTIFTTFL